MRKTGMSLISDFVCGTKNLLSQGFHSLPVILSTTILVLGMTQGNINLLFFFIGLSVLTPLACLLLNIIGELAFTKLGVPDSLWKLDESTAEACKLITTTISEVPQTLNVIPSYWLSIMAFFFTYLFLNAQDLYSKQSSSKASKAAIDARKNQTMISMVILSIAAILFTLIRYSTTCELGLGVVVSWVLGGGIAFGWHSFMRKCGLGRLDDIFGISNRLLPMQSYEEPSPTMCVPTST
jgi:hypothetical protein